MQLALVALGGAIGSAARHLAAFALGSSPLVTLAVNVAGSFLIGLLLANRVTEVVTLLVAVGVLGGFTTFSAFEWQLLEAIRQGSLGSAILYAGGSVILGLAAVWLGFAMGTRLAA